MRAAQQWLLERLQTPRRIAELCAEWCRGTQARGRDGFLQWVGGRDGDDGHRLEDLLQARRRLGVQAFAGADRATWWRLPPRTPNGDTRHHDATRLGAVPHAQPDDVITQILEVFPGAVVLAPGETEPDA